MKMDVNASVKRSVAVALALLGVVMLLMLAWIGGELSYSNCLKKEELAGKDGGSCSHFP